MFNKIVARIHGDAGQAADEYAVLAAVVLILSFLAFKVLSAAIQAQAIAATNSLCETPPCINR